MDNNIKKPKNKVWLENGIVYYVISKPVDEKEAILLDNFGTEFINSGQAFYIIIDIRQSSQFTSGARKVWVKFLQNSNAKKVAIFGGNIFVRTLASFVIAATHKKNIKFFNNKINALKWLMEK